MSRIDLEKVPVKTGSIYPAPYAAMMAGRSWSLLALLPLCLMGRARAPVMQGSAVRQRAAFIPRRPRDRSPPLLPRRSSPAESKGIRESRGPGARKCGDTAKGWELHAQAVSLKPGNYERWKGRALTLSAAFLNNTRYERCEPGSRAMPLVHVLREMVRLLKPCFPDEQAPTYDMVENWACRIDHPTRCDLMPEQQEELRQAA